MKTKILILGGSLFSGRMLSEKMANDSSLDLCLFNRGKSNPTLFTQLRKIHGMRDDEQMMQLAKEEWDVVVDFSAYYPIGFQKWIDAVKPNCKKYIFISTISVFDIPLFQQQAIKEDDPILSCSDEEARSPLPAAYGEKKAEMERILAASGMKHYILRPSYISGKYDYTQRFYHWIYRIQKGLPFVFPSLQHSNCSITIADDLVQTILTLCKADTSHAVYHVISQQKHTIYQFLQCAANYLHKEILAEAFSSEAILQKNGNPALFPLVQEEGFEVDQSRWMQDFSFERKNYGQHIQEILEYAERAGWPEPKSGISVEQEAILLEKLR